jgi:prepilin-type N-terminal cleavage/methylation domain-containing protein
MSKSAPMGTHRYTRWQSGFTLVETMISLVVLLIGVLGLAAVLADGMAYMNMSQYDYIAQQKAAEAVESIFTARDIGQATWPTICNVGSTLCTGGIFVAGAMPLCGPGTDGIIGTADDFNGGSCAGGPLAAPDGLILPNSTGIVNSTSGNLVPLSNFNRTIVITPVLDQNGHPIANLRQIQVTVTYASGRFANRPYTLTAYISNFS